MRFRPIVSRFTLLGLALWITGPVLFAAPPQGSVDIWEGDRVVFVGSAFVERMQDGNFLEHILTIAAPRRNATFRNLGWSGDTVWGDARAVFGSRPDGYKRLLGDLKEAKPTYVIVGYGENEAHEGETGLKTFEEGLETLLNDISQIAPRMTLIGPRNRQSNSTIRVPKDYNTKLKLYREAIRKTAARRGLGYVDLETLTDGLNVISDDTVHLNNYGGWITAPKLASLFGVSVRPWRLDLDLAKQSYSASGISIQDLKFEGASVSFSAKSHQLGMSPKPDDVPDGAKLHPQTNVGAVFISGSDKSYRIEIEDAMVGNGFAGNVKKPIMVANPLETEQSEKVRTLIGEKNFLFFNRYRPQNETYLFLFRKHEQGNNAVEIPQFDPLIEEAEKQIAALRTPKVYRYIVKPNP